LSVKRVRRRKPVRKRVGVGARIGRRPGFSGVVAVGGFVDRLDVVGAFDRGVGPIKQRDHGATAGELLVGFAQSQLLGGDA